MVNEQLEQIHADSLRLLARVRFNVLVCRYGTARHQMSGQIDHDRLDQILSWVPQVCELNGDWNAMAEFEGLRKLDKPGIAARRRMQHLERHLDAGEDVCDCFDEVRTDRLGR